MQSEATLSYTGLGDLLGRAIEDHAADLPAPQRRALEVALRLEGGSGRSADHRVVGAGARSLLAAEARTRPLVIAIDDLQWLDRASARAVGFAFRRLADEAIGLLATLRLDAGVLVASEHADLLRDRRVERLLVAPLSVGAIERLLREQLDLTLSRTALVHLHETARGNPLFALRARASARPLRSDHRAGPTVADHRRPTRALVQRLLRVPTDAREALLLASLLSDQAEDTLARALGRDWDQAIDRGREAGIIEAADGSVRFVHPLFASVVVGEATERERRAAHGRLATACDDGEERGVACRLATTEPDATIAEALEEAANQATWRGAARRGG